MTLSLKTNVTEVMFAKSILLFTKGNTSESTCFQYSGACMISIMDDLQ